MCITELQKNVLVNRERLRARLWGTYSKTYLMILGNSFLCLSFLICKMSVIEFL